MELLILKYKFPKIYLSIHKFRRPYGPIGIRKTVLHEGIAIQVQLDKIHTYRLLEK